MPKFMSKDWGSTEEGAVQTQCKKMGSCTRKLKIGVTKEREMEVENGSCGHGQVGDGKIEW